MALEKVGALGLAASPPRAFPGWRERGTEIQWDYGAFSVFLVYLRSTKLLPKLYLLPVNQGNQSPSQPCVRYFIHWKQPEQVVAFLAPGNGEQPQLPACRALPGAFPGCSRREWQPAEGQVSKAEWVDQETFLWVSSA